MLMRIRRPAGTSTVGLGLMNVFLRVIDSGGAAWESDKTYANLDDAFLEMNVAIEIWCAKNGIEFEL